MSRFAGFGTILVAAAALGCGEDRRGGGAAGRDAPADTAPSWQTFEPPGATFTVAMPGEPRPIPSGAAARGIRMIAWNVKTPAGVEYVVSETWFDPAIHHDGRLSVEGGIDGLVSTFAGTERERREVALGRHPGLEASVVAGRHRDIAGEAHATARLFIVGNTAYSQVVLHAAATAVPRGDLDRFFDSLRLPGDR